MGGFANSIMGGAQKLIRKAIQSPNYVPGSAGWSINKDGTAEFSSGTFRGTLSANSLTNTSIGSSTFTGGTISQSTVTEPTITFDSGGGLLLVYATTTTVTTYTTSGSFNVPSGITSIKAECWGAGGGGQGGSGAGGGGGEYAAEPTLTVTPLETLTVTIGAGGSGGIGGVGGPGSNGGATTLQRSSTALVTANGGQGSATATTTGGTGSTNSVHFNGGGSHANSTGTSTGGAGGGGSAGPSSAGNAGASNSGQTGGAGAAAVTGGGAGGHGGNGTGSGGTAGAAGGAPGGGGGAGGAGSSANSAGGNGAGGKVVITYVSAQTLIGAIAPAAGTDPSGNKYPEGLAGIQQGTDYAVLAPNGTHAALLFGTAGNAADTNLYRSAAGVLQTDSSLVIGGVGQVLAKYKANHTGRASTTTPTADPDLQLSVSANSIYEVTAHISYNCGTTGVDLKFTFGIPAGAVGSYGDVYLNTGGTISVEEHSWTDTSAGKAISSNNTILVRGTLETSSAGTLSFNWSQNTSNAAQVFVNQDAHLIARRIGP